mmetsp:Transcript_24056/g.43563  ORF Transcript_24056/g.43563 Transcript_24056/m.43563 type:complete len:201 (-) Transcript_24056:2-604(-)
MLWSKERSPNEVPGLHTCSWSWPLDMEKLPSKTKKQESPCSPFETITSPFLVGRATVRSSNDLISCGSKAQKRKCSSMASSKMSCGVGIGFLLGEPGSTVRFSSPTWPGRVADEGTSLFSFSVCPLWTGSAAASSGTTAVSCAAEEEISPVLWGGAGCSDLGIVPQPIFESRMPNHRSQAPSPPSHATHGWMAISTSRRT